MSINPPSCEDSLPETHHQEKKKSGKKKGVNLEETKTSNQNNPRQTLLTHYCKKTSDASCSLKSEDLYTSLTMNRIKLLEQQLAKKEETISKIKAEKEEQQRKTARVSMEYEQVVAKTKVAMIEGKKKLAEISRKERATINPKLGYYKDSLYTNFQEGQYLTSIRDELKQAEKALEWTAKEGKSSPSEEMRDILKSKAEFYKKEVKVLQSQLELRLKEVEKYQDRIKVASKEQQCQLAKEKWPLLKNKYLPLELIGTGGFGEVYKGFDIDKLQDVAIKISLPDPRLSLAAHENLIKHLKREIETHKQLQHPNIVKVIDQIEFEGRLGFVMEYCKGPELKSYIKKSVCIQEGEAKQILKQLLFAVKYLHQQKIKVVHFDLKPANIIFHCGLIKIVDFGICKTIDHEETKIDLTSPGIGTYWYLPPEVFDQNNAHVSSKVDIWSIGVIFFQMLYGEKPFGQGFSQAKILREGVILNANKVEFPEQNSKRYKVSSEAKEFIKACLKYDHKERLSPLEAYEHPYIVEK